MNTFIETHLGHFNREDDHAFVRALRTAGIRFRHAESGENNHLYLVEQFNRLHFLCIPHEAEDRYYLQHLTGSRAAILAQYHALAVHYGGAASGEYWQVVCDAHREIYRTVVRTPEGVCRFDICLYNGQLNYADLHQIDNRFTNALSRVEPKQQWSFPCGRMRIVLSQGIRYLFYQEFGHRQYRCEAALLPPGYNPVILLYAQAFLWDAPLPDDWVGWRLHDSCLLLQRYDWPQRHVIRIKDGLVTGACELPSGENEVMLSAFLRTALMDTTVSDGLAAIMETSVLELHRCHAHPMLYALLYHRGCYYAMEAWGSQNLRLCRILSGEAGFRAQMLRWLGDYPWLGDAHALARDFGLHELPPVAA